MAEEETRDLLSEHQTLAVFTGQSHRPCMFRTALCPDRCGHALHAYDFDIKKYFKHVKPGQYGDEQQQKYHFDTKALSFQKFGTVAQALKPGDLVLLDWIHEYVHKAGCHSPDRNVTKLEPISEDTALQLMSK